MIPDEMIPVPEDLQERLGDAISAAILSEQGPDALTAEPRPVSRRTHPALREKRPARRWLWGAVPAVALASLAAVLLVNRPQPLPPETATAFAELESIFGNFSEAMQISYDSFSIPNNDLTRNP